MTPNVQSSDLDRKLAYVVFRLTLGINILVHGAGRIFGPGAEGFAAQTAVEFAKTPLPAGMVHLFLVFVPFAEATLGALTTLGLLTRWSLTVGGLLMTVLVFGTAMRSDWTTVGVQMIYAIIYYLLLVNRADNRYSVDAWLGQN
ncbi:MAG TPA: DoxX family membrane protein [Bryobacteraceae bacterium]|nr:DoxX family membrane protein [Bryobacteraceae bacterium]